MNWKNRLTNYNFWVSIVSAIILVLQALKVKLDFVYVNEVFTAVLGLLVVLGIINDPTKSTKSQTKTQVDNSTSEKLETQPKPENEQKNLENVENNTQNQEKTENLGENLENLQNFSEETEISPNEIEVENLQTETTKQQENVELLEKQNNCIPHNEENETSVSTVQNNLSANQIENFKIVN